MDAYSLYELNEYIKRVIALNFSESVWIKGEISQIKHSRGQIYLDLVEKDEKSDQIIAQASGIIWYNSYLFIKKKLGELTDVILQDGCDVSLKVSISFHERYGLKLNIEDVDPSYTLGQIELNRQKIIERLDKEGMLHLNKQHELSTVLQNIAVISSATSAGYKDFMAQLEENPYGYKFNIQLFNVAVQGRSVSKEICEALKTIDQMNFDTAVLIRGGGSKIDLSGFDDFNIGARISKSNIPIISGIGHEIDNTVTDIVAHTNLKTPTAVADFLIEHNLFFESELIELGNEVFNLTNYKLNEANLELNNISQLIEILPQEKILSEYNRLNNISEQLNISVDFKLKAFQTELINTEKLIASYGLDKILKRGFSLIKRKEKYLTSSKELKNKDEIEIVLFDGTKKAIIND